MNRKKLLNKKVIIEIRENLLKVAQVMKKKDKIIILKFFSMNISGELSSDNNIDKIKDKLHSKGINHGEVYLIINNIEAKNEIVKIPILKYKFQLKILEEKYGSNQNEDYIQYSYSGKDESHSNYIVYRVNREKIKKYREFIEKLGFKAKRLDIKSNTYMKLMNYGQTLNGQYNVLKHKLLIIDIGKNNTVLTILDKGKIKWITSLRFGVNYISNSDVENSIEIVQKLLDFSNLIKESVERVSNELDLIIIDGDCLRRLDIKSTLSKTFEITTFHINKLERINSEIENEDIRDYLSMLGGILRRKRSLNGRYKFF